MLDCFETCHYENQKCEQAYWTEEIQTCHWVKTDGPQGMPTSTLPCEFPYCPWDRAPGDYITAVSTPISPFVIHCAEYGNFDIQNEARAWWNKGHWLEITVDWYWQVVGDPFPYIQKSYFVFYQYGPESRLISALETDNFIIQPGPAVSYPGKQRVVADPNPMWEAQKSQGGKYAKIWDVAWGSGLLDLDVVDIVMADAYWFIANRHDMLMSVTLWRVDNWFGMPKVGCFFAERNDLPGIIYSVCNKDGQVVYANSFGSPMKKRDVDGYENGFLLDARDDAGENDTVETADPNTDNNPDTDTETVETVDTNTDSNTDENTDDDADTPTVSNADLDFVKVMIQDTTDSISLRPGKDGNLWVSTETTSAEDVALFSNGAEFAGLTTPSKLVMGDSNENILHYFPDEFEATGASRLRLAQWDKIPHGARLLNLIPVTSGDATILVGADTQGNHGFLYFCAIENQLNKVFLVKDPLNGEAALQDENMKFIVTGGQASSCGPLALTAHFIVEI